MSRITSRSLGDAQITILTTGSADFGPELFPGTAPEHINALMAQQNAASIATNFNAVLIRHGGRVVLADAGPRELFGPTCGFLPQALKEAGVTPAQVDTLFATHMHPDHVAGMITPQGQAVFANAELAVSQSEYAFWSDTAGISGLSKPVQDWAALARAVFAAYGDRLRLVADGAQIVPGLTTLPLPGHTPGHSGWRLDSNGATLLHVGDIVHAPVLQVADPEIAIAFDLDPAQAREARKRLLDQIASEDALFTGGHFLQPAFSRLTRHGQGYRLVQA